MFTYVYSCLITYAYLCLLMFTMFTRVYQSLAQFTCVYLCLLVFTYINSRFPVCLYLLTFTYVYHYLWHSRRKSTFPAQKHKNEFFMPCCSPYIAVSSGACGASIRGSVQDLRGEKCRSLSEQLAEKSAIKHIFHVSVHVRNSLKWVWYIHPRTYEANC